MNLYKKYRAEIVWYGLSSGTDSLFYYVVYS